MFNRGHGLRGRARAVIAANYLLDPDLLAAGFLFIYFALVLDPALPRQPGQAFLSGIAAGLAYLAKAYMLPFVLIHLPLSLWIAHRGSRQAGRSIFPRPRNARNARPPWPRNNAAWLVAWLLGLAGLALVAAPWVGVLSAKYHHFTFSTAGSANHANVGPTNNGQDLLWHPGLTVDFISDPHYGPDWSPFQDGGHFLHQIKLIGHNFGVACVHLFPWLLLVPLAAAWWATRRGSSPQRSSGTASGACPHAQSAVPVEPQAAPEPPPPRPPRTRPTAR